MTPPAESQRPRRKTDTWDRYGVTVLSTMSAVMLTISGALLSLVYKFYGNLPDQMQIMSASILKMDGRLANVERNQDSILASQHVEEDWRRRQVQLEVEVRRNTSDISKHDSRLDELEKRPLPLHR